MNTRKRKVLNDVSLSMDQPLISPTENSSLKGDRLNIAILFFLYILQGIPLGLSAAIPMILQNRGISYREQAEFSFVNWPFSLKLLWAPIVDAVFWPKMGRRKTWLIPTQYLIGLHMFFISIYVNKWLGDEDNTPNTGMLTFVFTALNFLAATQDIVVDGWALTMLKKCNVGHASTCNSAGQTAGYFLGYVLFMALESAEFCNNYLRAVPAKEGIVTLPGFLYFWSIIFIVATTLVAIFKKERTITVNDVDHEQDEIETNIWKAYSTLLKIMKLPSVRTLALILLTAKIGFAATDAVSSLKLVEGGLPKEKLAFMAVPLIPLQIVLVLIISKWTSGPRPMDIFLKALPYRLLFGFAAAALVWITPKIVVDGNIPLYYYVILLLNYAFHQICLNSMFVAIMAFFAKISDPAVGGTYMTLLNTLCNLGGNWPATLALWLVDGLTWQFCAGTGPALTDNMCSTIEEQKQCKAAGGKCNVIFDGFYVETVICIVAGYIWLLFVRGKIKYLQSLSSNAWKISSSRTR